MICGRSTELRENYRELQRWHSKSAALISHQTQNWRQRRERRLTICRSRHRASSACSSMFKRKQVLLWSFMCASWIVRHDVTIMQMHLFAVSWFCLLLSLQGSQTVWVTPHGRTTPSPGWHWMQHSPLAVYWPDAQSFLLARAPTCQSERERNHLKERAKQRGKRLLSATS